MDYGFRISEEGKDVKTCTDLECVLTSKYPVLKGGMEGTGNISATAASDETAVGTFDIEHNLGYIPVVRLFTVADGEFYEIPETDWGAGVYIFEVDYEHISVNLIRVTAELWVSGDVPVLDLDIKYYVSLEKVNI